MNKVADWYKIGAGIEPVTFIIKVFKLLENNFCKELNLLLFYNLWYEWDNYDEQTKKIIQLPYFWDKLVKWWNMMNVPCSLLGVRLLYLYKNNNKEVSGVEVNDYHRPCSVHGRW